jgi:hypothetical protein
MAEVVTQARDPGWNLEVAGTKDWLRDSLVGWRVTISGHTKRAGSAFLIEVEFDPINKQSKRYGLPEPIGERFIAVGRASRRREAYA